ncbi:hypothetical protein [Nocardia sp. NPDC056100]|uniref:hypothetical protein n=1 Tax=Nocardia sp. NPDC056100 TaxID=3345712 RepID=UPI0035D8BE37
MDWSRVRRILDDAMWVLVGMVCAFVIAVGGIWLLLVNLNTTLGNPRWDGELAFIANCSPGISCVIKSVPEQTPPLAIRGSGLSAITLVPQPAIAELRTGDRVLCTVHVELADSDINDNATISTASDCRRA